MSSLRVHGKIRLNCEFVVSSLKRTHWVFWSLPPVTFKTLATMPLAQVAKEYLGVRVRVMKESNIISTWKKSGILTLNLNSFNKSDYGPSQITSINTFLPPLYLQAESTAVNLDLQPDTASDTEEATSSDDELDSDFNPANKHDWVHSSHSDADNTAQTDTTGVSDPSLPQASSSIPVQGVSQFSTPPLSPKPPQDRAYQQCQLGATLRKLPALAWPHGVPTHMDFWLHFHLVLQKQIVVSSTNAWSRQSTRTCQMKTRDFVSRSASSNRTRQSSQNSWRPQTLTASLLESISQISRLKIMQRKMINKNVPTQRLNGSWARPTGRGDHRRRQSMKGKKQKTRLQVCGRKLKHENGKGCGTNEPWQGSLPGWWGAKGRMIWRTLLRHSVWMWTERTRNSPIASTTISM